MRAARLLLLYRGVSAMRLIFISEPPSPVYANKRALQGFRGIQLRCVTPPSDPVLASVNNGYRTELPNQDKILPLKTPSLRCQ
jgi:hypothetical protein